MGPKWFAIQNSLPTAKLWVAGPLHWFYRVSYPFNWILNQSAQWLLRRVGIEPSGSTRFVHSEEELRLMFGQRQIGGGAGARHRVKRAGAGRHLVRNVMRPRQEIAAFDTGQTSANALRSRKRRDANASPFARAATDGISRRCAYQGSLRGGFQNGARGGPQRIARKLIYVQEPRDLKKCSSFSWRKLFYAIVVDEYEISPWHVTLENVLEVVRANPGRSSFQEKPLLLRRVKIIGRSTALPLHELWPNWWAGPFRRWHFSTASGWLAPGLGGTEEEIC